MNTFSTGFGFSVVKANHLRAQLEEYLAEHRGGEFTFEDFCETFQPENYDILAIVLGQLVQAGKLKQIIRVYSQKVPGGGIGDFETISEVPNQMFDVRGNTQMEVTAENIRVIYKVP